MAALQTEYSPSWREPEAAIIPTLEEPGIGFDPFSPLGKGHLAGKIDEGATFDGSDLRTTVPRSSPESRKAIQAVVYLLGSIAQRRNPTPAQIALAWLVVQTLWIEPIPGTMELHRLQENVGAAPLELAAENFADIQPVASQIEVQGGVTLSSRSGLLTAESPRLMIPCGTLSAWVYYRMEQVGEASGEASEDPVEERVNAVPLPGTCPNIEIDPRDAG